jgi:phage-related baseplate assembly protein
MPVYQSQDLFIDFARLPAPSVIETIAYEDLLTAYKARVLSANNDLAAALALEQSPLNIILETEAYGEMIVRERINMAARAVMLPFATGSDLDVLGALYGVARLPLVSTPAFVPDQPRGLAVRRPRSGRRSRSRRKPSPRPVRSAPTSSTPRMPTRASSMRTRFRSRPAACVSS